MPESILEGFVVLESFEHDADRIRLRFVPNFFEVEHVRPVVCVEIQSCADVQEAPRKIAAIQRDTVVGMNADAQTLEVWQMYEDQPIAFRGCVTWTHEDYGIPDYIRAVNDGDRAADEMHKKMAQLRRTIDRVAGFVDRAIDRAERKEGAAKSGDGRYAKEAQLLRSIRRQFSDD